MIRSVFIIAALFVNVAWTKSCFNNTATEYMIRGVGIRCTAKVQAKYFESKESKGEYDTEECKEDFTKCVSDCIDIYQNNDRKIDCKKFGELALYFAYDRKVTEEKFTPIVKECCTKNDKDNNDDNDKIELFMKCVANDVKKICGEEDGKFLEDSFVSFNKVQEDACDFKKYE